MCRIGRGSRSPASRVVFYTRVGCHLCDDAWDLVCRAQSRHTFTLTRVDVDTDPALRALHGERVPVVEVDGRVRLWGRVNAVLLERLLSSRRKPEARATEG